MRILVMLLAAIIAFSGCTEPAPEAEDDPAEQPTDLPGLGRGDGDQAQNAAPVIEVAVDVSNGTVPFNVTVTITGSDADGDVLAWDVSSAGTSIANGTGLPAEVVVAVDTAGNHTFTVTVSDGNATVAQEITVVAGEPAAPAEPAFEPITLSHDILLSCPHCSAGPDLGESTCIAVITDDNGLDCAFWELPPEFQGRTWTAGGTFIPVLEFYPDCTGIGLIEFSLDGTGTVPDGAGCAVLYDLIDPVVTATLRIE